MRRCSTVLERRKKSVVRCVKQRSETDGVVQCSGGGGGNVGIMATVLRGGDCDGSDTGRVALVVVSVV